MAWFARILAGRGLGASVALTLALGGCAASTKPVELLPPMQFSCFTLPSALTFTETRGLMSVMWMTRLEQGPYVSEHVDAGGTYFRGPPGGIFYGYADGTHLESNFHAAYGPRDGGIYVPNNPALPPHLYTYFSLGDVEPVAPPDGTDCSGVRYIPDPVTKGQLTIFIVETAKTHSHSSAPKASAPHATSRGGGGAGGAAGGVLGAVIASAIVSGINNADVGNIRAEPALTDPQMLADLKRLAMTARPLDPSQLAPATPYPTAVAAAPMALAPVPPTPDLPPPPSVPVTTAPVPLAKPIEAPAPLPPPPVKPIEAPPAPSPVAVAAIPAAASDPYNQRGPASGRVPYLTDEKQQKFLDYLAKPKPRAFAISENGHFASVWGGARDANGVPVDAQTRALEGCRSAAGQECALFAVDDTVVFYGAPYTFE